MNALLKSVLLVLLVTLTCTIPTSLAVESYTDITVSEFNALLDSSPSLVILDVRSVTEYESGHIRHAQLIPHTELPLRLDELNQNDTIVYYVPWLSMM